jgi:NADPH:quinone reductase-like Zn-dependent oxidoreductase
VRAVILNEFGAEPQLADIAEPRPGTGEVLVRIHASSVNGFDLSVASGAAAAWFKYELPLTLGADYAGVVEQVGDGVKRWARGDEVFGFFQKEVLKDGAWGELVVLPEDMFVGRKPSRLSFAEAGGLSLAGIGALQAIEGIDASEGDRVLVVGATGGVGSFAVQLAAARGALVVATVSPEDDARLRGLGATETIDFTNEDVAAVVRDRHPDGVDALVDLVTPADAIATFTDLVRSGGRVATTTGAADAEVLATREIETTAVWATADPESLARLASHVDAGDLRVEIGESFTLEQASAALDAFRRGSHGKIGVEVAA